MGGAGTQLDPPTCRGILQHVCITTGDPKRKRKRPQNGTPQQPPGRHSGLRHVGGRCRVQEVHQQVLKGAEGQAVPSEKK